jgi:hypothetical protein
VEELHFAKAGTWLFLIQRKKTAGFFLCICGHNVVFYLPGKKTGLSFSAGK